MKQILIFILTISIFTSCYTPPEPGIGIVTVLDTNDFRVPSASVKLSKGTILVEGYTDSNGEFSYTHQPNPELYQTHDVILDVNVQKGNLIGYGIIEIRVGEINERTIRIY